MTYWYNDSIARRYKVQRRLKNIGRGAIFSIFAFISILLIGIGYEAFPAFQKTYIAIDVPIQQQLSSRKIIYDYMYKRFSVTSRKDKKAIRNLFSSTASYRLDAYVKNNMGLLGDNVRVWLPASDVVDQYIKGAIGREIPENRRKFSNKQMSWIDKLHLTEQIQLRFNTAFFTNADSRDPTEAGILSAIWGSLMTLAVCLGVTFFVGVLGAVYLEEFAPKNIVSYFIEISINNLAAVPSIIFGLLGLAILLNVFGMPRSASVTGGLVLAMMSLPTIVIATRNALKAVPDSLRYAGLSLGCTRLQVVFHHVLPRAIPSIITGTIIAMVQALGETAPLLMIGMVAFIADVPTSLADPAVTLPVQIFLWSDVPAAAFFEKTAAAILVLMCIVCTLIAIAGYMRYRFEKK